MAHLLRDFFITIPNYLSSFFSLFLFLGLEISFIVKASLLQEMEWTTLSGLSR